MIHAETFFANGHLLPAKISICFSGGPSLCFALFCGYSVYVILHSWLNN